MVWKKINLVNLIKSPSLLYFMKTLFVGNKTPNQIHKKLADAVDARFYGYGQDNLKEIIAGLRKIPKGYDIYLTEGLFNYVVLARMLGFLDRDVKIINLFADPRLFYLKHEKQFDFKKGEIKNSNFIKKIFRNWLIKKLDGAMVEGKFQKLLFESVTKNVDSRIFYPFMSGDFFFKTSSPLKEKNILFVGNGPDYYVKGIDYLLEIFAKILEKSPESKLFIIGADLEKFRKRYEWHENIIFLGKQDAKSIQKIMETCCLYCHFGRGEAFGVSTLEAMAAGIPCMVSSFTGVGEVVEKVREDFVVDVQNKERVIKKILDYLDLDVREKIILGKKFREEARFFNEKNCLEIFRKGFKDLIGEIKDE